MEHAHFEAPIPEDPSLPNWTSQPVRSSLLRYPQLPRRAAPSSSSGHGASPGSRPRWQSFVSRINPRRDPDDERPSNAASDQDSAHRERSPPVGEQNVLIKNDNERLRREKGKRDGRPQHGTSPPSRRPSLWDEVARRPSQARVTAPPIPPHVLPRRHQPALVIGGWVAILAVLRGLPLQLHRQALMAALPQPSETRQPAPRPTGGTRHSSRPRGGHPPSHPNHIKRDEQPHRNFGEHQRAPRGVEKLKPPGAPITPPRPSPTGR